MRSKLPDIADFCRTCLGIDPAEAPIPVQPTAHYVMGGIPTDNEGRVLADSSGALTEGLYAAGECACISVHGENRLGTNSLVDLVVYGWRAGQHIARYVLETDLSPLGADPEGPARSWIETLNDGQNGPHCSMIQEETTDVVMERVGIYHNEEDIQEAVKELQRLRAWYQTVRAQDRSRRYNTDPVEIFELRELLGLALVTAASAEHCEESRGAQAREDHLERDDENWLKQKLKL